MAEQKLCFCVFTSSLYCNTRSYMYNLVIASPRDHWSEFYEMCLWCSKSGLDASPPPTKKIDQTTNNFLPFNNRADSIDQYSWTSAFFACLLLLNANTVTVSILHLLRDHWLYFFEACLGCCLCGPFVHHQLWFWFLDKHGCRWPS